MNPDSVLFGRGLTLAARSVYPVIARHVRPSKVAYIGMRRMAEILECSVGTVASGIDVLVAKGHMEIVKDGPGRRQGYRLTSNRFERRRYRGEIDGEIVEHYEVEDVAHKRLIQSRPRRKIA